MQSETLKAEKREATGKSAARALRRQGVTPCVIYNKGEDTEHLVVPTRDLETAMRQGDRVLQIAVGSEAPRPAFVKEVQYEVLTEKILHVDFTIISMDEKIEVDVPVVLKGEAAGIKAGGLIEHVLHNVTVSCLPDRIPEDITIDINEMEVGDSWHVTDIALPEDVEFVTPGDALVLSCHMPRGEAEEEEIPEEAEEPVRVGEEEEKEAATEETAETETKE